MKVVRQGDSDTFTYVSEHTRTCKLYCYLRMAFNLQLELPKWMRSMAQSVPVMVVKEPVSVADRQKKIVNTKTDVNTKRKKKHLKKTRKYFSNADSLLLVHNPPSCSFKRFYTGENKPRRTQFSNLTQSAPGLQKDVSKEQQYTKYQQTLSLLFRCQNVCEMECQNTIKIKSHGTLYENFKQTHLKNQRQKRSAIKESGIA